MLLAEFYSARLDEDEAWAIAASADIGRPAPDSGEHWQWQRHHDEQVITPDLSAGLDPFSDDQPVSLRSAENYPYDGISGSGPHLVIWRLHDDIGTLTHGIAGHLA